MLLKIMYHTKLVNWLLLEFFYLAFSNHTDHVTETSKKSKCALKKILYILTKQILGFHAGRMEPQNVADLTLNSISVISSLFSETPKQRKSQKSHNLKKSSHCPCVLQTTQSLLSVSIFRVDGLI